MFVTMLAILALFGGLLIGSFLNVCAYRLPRDISVVKPARSFCPECEHMIAWYDNLPVLSYILLRGKCRHCAAYIPWSYPLVELGTGMAFAACVLYWGATLESVKYMLFAAILITLVASDFADRILPDEFTLGGLVAGLIIAAFVPNSTLFGYFLLPMDWPNWVKSVCESALAGGIASGSIWFVGWVYSKIRDRDGLGLGDVKMIAMIGAFLGLQAALATLVLSSLLGSVLGLIYIKISKQEASTYELPFGSFIGLSAMVIAVMQRNLPH